MPKKEPLRSCIVTREEHPQSALLRFAISPEGQVVFDYKGNLPGRGMWVKPQYALVIEACRKNIYSKSAKEKLKFSEDLAEQVAMQLKAKALAMLGRGWRAGEMVTGYEKVLTMLQSGNAGVLIHAEDASDDGRRKLDNVAGQGGVIALSFASRQELAEVLQKENPVHLALQKGQICTSFCQLHGQWLEYIASKACG